MLSIRYARLLAVATLLIAGARSAAAQNRPEPPRGGFPVSFRNLTDKCVWVTFYGAPDIGAGWDIIKGASTQRMNTGPLFVDALNTYDFTLPRLENKYKIRTQVGNKSCKAGDGKGDGTLFDTDMIIERSLNGAKDAYVVVQKGNGNYYLMTTYHK